MSAERFRLVSDDSAHQYVIPDVMYDDWLVWLESQDAEDGVTPSWARRLPGSPEALTFEAPRWDGRPIP